MSEQQKNLSWKENFFTRTKSNVDHNLHNNGSKTRINRKHLHYGSRVTAFGPEY